MANANESPTGGNETKRKSGKMVWIIVGTVNLLLIAGGAFFVLTRSSTAQPAKPAADAHGAPAAAPAHAASTAATGPLLKLDPFIANLNEPDGNRYIKMTLAIELGNEAALPTAEKSMPRLRDGVLVYLSGLGVGDTQGAEGKEAIRKELLDRARRVLGQAVAKNVFYSEFVLQ